MVAWVGGCAAVAAAAAAAAIHAGISIRLMEQYRTYIVCNMIIYIGRDNI